MVHITHARGISFDQCEFRASGGYAWWAEEGAYDCSLTRTTRPFLPFCLLRHNWLPQPDDSMACMRRLYADGPRERGGSARARPRCRQHRQGRVRGAHHRGQHRKRPNQPFTARVWRLSGRGGHGVRFQMSDGGHVCQEGCGILAQNIGNTTLTHNEITHIYRQ